MLYLLNKFGRTNLSHQRSQISPFEILHFSYFSKIIFFYFGWRAITFNFQSRSYISQVLPSVAVINLNRFQILHLNFKPHILHQNTKTHKIFEIKTTRNKNTKTHKIFKTNIPKHTKHHFSQRLSLPKKATDDYCCLTSP